MSRARGIGIALAALLATGIAAAPAGAAQIGPAQAAPERTAPTKAAPNRGGVERDDAEQRGHVIPDEDTSPEIVRPTPAPPVTPPPPVVAASPVRAESPAPAAAPRDELPQTGGEEGLLLLWFGGLVAGAGLCLRRAIA